MLKINAEPGFFTEVFTELKSCGQYHPTLKSYCGGAWRMDDREIIVNLSLSAHRQKFPEEMMAKYR